MYLLLAALIGGAVIVLLLGQRRRSSKKNCFTWCPFMGACNNCPVPVDERDGDIK